MSLTRSQADALGNRIRHGELTDDDRRLLLELRASYLPAYQQVTGKIRELGLRPTGRPEKTPESIVNKLRRRPTRLSTIQDIAGCRIVVADVRVQDVVVERLVQAFPGCRVDDRRRRPSHGYRAVHVIAFVDNLPIEIPVRTYLQHRWANLVEVEADEFGIEFKYGSVPPGGDPATLEILMLASEAVAMTEAEPWEALVPEDPEEAAPYRDGQFAGIIAASVSAILNRRR